MNNISFKTLCTQYWQEQKYRKCLPNKQSRSRKVFEANYSLPNIPKENLIILFPNISYRNSIYFGNGDLFNEDYYERGVETGISGYQNYSWRPDITIPLCERIIEVLKLKDTDKILDYGCAKGYYVKAFRELGINAYGFDISKYAVSQAPKDIKNYVSNKLNCYDYDWIIAKNVLEHVRYEDIDCLLKMLNERCQNMFCIVPLGKDGKYVIPSCEKDVTHIIREPLEWWKDKFEKAGFNAQKACYQIDGIHERHSCYKEGIGFFILSKQQSILN